MDLWLDVKYINLLGSHLDRFTQVRDNVWNFRCPHCKDSVLSKKKARGYIYLKEADYRFHCHNCKSSQLFRNFLKGLNSELYGQYLIEKLGKKEDRSPNPTKNEVDEEIVDPLVSLPRISNLSPDHPGKKYVVGRQIPTPYHHRLFWCANFSKLVNSLPNQEKVTSPSPRLIIPFYGLDNKLMGFQGRSLNPQDPYRYITVMLKPKSLKIFGLDRVNLNETFYCLEGPIDAMYLPNSLASMGGKIDTVLSAIKAPKANCVVLYDNQPRNPQVVQQISDAISGGYKVFIWPETLADKDLGEYVQRLVGPSEYVQTEKIQSIINRFENILTDRTFSGIRAELELKTWRKT